MRDTIPSNRFEENSDIIISDLQDAYVEDEGDKVSTYVPFSATSVCSVEISYDDEFRRCASHKMYRLTNEENIDNLYALCVTLNEDNNARREVRVTLKVNGCSGFISRTSQFLITQEACTCTVTYDWGNFASPDVYSYHIGDTISSSDIRHTVADVERAGYVWDGKFYYSRQSSQSEVQSSLRSAPVRRVMTMSSSSTSQEVNFNVDTVRGFTTVFARLSKRLMFDVKDARSRVLIDGADIRINGNPVTLLSAEGTGYGYVIEAPCSSDDETFVITVSREPYPDGRRYSDTTITHSFSSLNKGEILLERFMEPNEFTITLKWYIEPRYAYPSEDDMDSHLVICDSNGNSKAHLNYSSNQPSGYASWWNTHHWDGDSMPTDAVEYDGFYYELDFDDLDGKKYYTEHIHGWINTDSDDRIYRFFVKDYNRHHRMYDWDVSVSIDLGNTYYPQSVSGAEFYKVRDISDTGKLYWIVFDIKKVNGRWTVVPTTSANDKYICNGHEYDAYGDSAPYYGG